MEIISQESGEYNKTLYFSVQVNRFSLISSLAYVIIVQELMSVKIK